MFRFEGDFRECNHLLPFFRNPKESLFGAVQLHVFCNFLVVHVHGFTGPECLFSKQLHLNTFFRRHPIPSLSFQKYPPDRVTLIVPEVLPYAACRLIPPTKRITVTPPFDLEVCATLRKDQHGIKWSIPLPSPVDDDGQVATLFTDCCR